MDRWEGATRVLGDLSRKFSGLQICIARSELMAGALCSDLGGVAGGGMEGLCRRTRKLLRDDDIYQRERFPNDWVRVVPKEMREHLAVELRMMEVGLVERPALSCILSLIRRKTSTVMKERTLDLTFTLAQSSGRRSMGFC